MWFIYLFNFFLPNIFPFLKYKRERHFLGTDRARAAEGIAVSICLPFLFLLCKFFSYEKRISFRLQAIGQAHVEFGVCVSQEAGEADWNKSWEGLQSVVRMSGFNLVCNWGGVGGLDWQGRVCMLELGVPAGLLQESWWSVQRVRTGWIRERRENRPDEVND